MTPPVSRGGVLGSFRSVGTVEAHLCQRLLPVFLRSIDAFFDAVAHSMCGLLPSAGQLSLILMSSLFWSLASCATFGRSKGPNLLLCVDTAPLMGGGDVGLHWCENRSCETPGDAPSKLNLDMVGKDLLFQLEERRVPLVGSAPGWCESLLLLDFFPGRCFPSFLSLFFSVLLR